jgi:hypothetical protein
MTNRRILYVGQSIVDQSGKMQQAFNEWQQLVTRTLPFRGSGTPEGNVSAPEDSWYVDTAGSAGSRLYFKVLSDVSGDDSKGWEVIG